jgi:hypothetical protein
VAYLEVGGPRARYFHGVFTLKYKEELHELVKF